MADLFTAQNLVAFLTLTGLFEFGPSTSPGPLASRGRRTSDTGPSCHDEHKQPISDHRTQHCKRKSKYTPSSMHNESQQHRQINTLL